MILSLQHEFIFIHVYRTGGTSIRTALERYGHDPGKTFFRRVLKRLGISIPEEKLPYRYRNYYRHIRARDLREQLPAQVFQDSFKFGFVRNPWEVQVSMYHYILSNPNHYFYRDVSGMKSFEEYVSWVVKSYRKLQKDFLMDADGNMLVDYVGRFENLSDDFERICKTIGIRSDLPSVNGTRHDDYRLYYSPASRALIEEHYRDDIEAFGYTFEGPRLGSKVLSPRSKVRGPHESLRL